MIKVTTLREFIIKEQAMHPDSSGELSSVLRDIVVSSKIVNREVNKAGLVDILGSTGYTNIQGEDVQKLDEFAHDRFVAAFKLGGQCCGVASEESDDFISIPPMGDLVPKYLVAIDPLDGSSNIDVNVSVGTIFSIYQRISKPGPCTLEDFLQPGVNQVAAGYVVYGSSTMLVYTTGNGLNGFTLDPSIGEFCLSHPNIKIPKSSGTFSVNTSYYKTYGEGVKKFIDYCESEDKATGRPYSLRYIGSMVADVHRNLIKGGIFMYPATSKVPKGKLRLLYECNPMAFIVEQAGGRASDGFNRILDLKPTELHQRAPIFIGAEDMVLKADELIAEYG